MIALPRARTLSQGPLRAFCLTLCTLATAIWAAAGRRRPRRRTLPVIGALAAGGVAGILRPSLVRPAYLAWDRGARWFSRRATAYAAWVTHMTALPPGDDQLRADGSRDPRRTSGWETVGAGQVVPEASLAVDPTHRSGTSSVHTVRRRLRDRSQPRGRWLAACLAVLRFLQPSDEPVAAPVANDNYTLY